MGVRDSTRVGQVYRDEMFDADMQVTATDDVAVYIRHAADVGEAASNKGTPYLWDMWADARAAERFTLKEDADPTDEDETAERDTRAADDAAGGEETTEDENVSEDNFSHNSALSW